MRLTELNPRGIGHKGYLGRVGITFDCPCCLNTERATRLAIYFIKDVVGEHGEAIHINDIAWNVFNPQDYETITVSPSIDASGEPHRHWHGWIRNGNIE